MGKIVNLKKSYGPVLAHFCPLLIATGQYLTPFLGSRSLLHSQEAKLCFKELTTGIQINSKTVSSCFNKSSPNKFSTGLYGIYSFFQHFWRKGREGSGIAFQQLVIVFLIFVIPIEILMCGIYFFPTVTSNYLVQNGLCHLISGPM